MTNFPGPPTWSAASVYIANQHEVDGSNGFYYVASVGGTPGVSPPTWASVFNTPVVDNAVTWVCAQRSRQPWASVAPYSAGLPLLTTGSVSTTSNLMHSVPNSRFIGIGSYILGTGVVAGTQVTAVATAASLITMSTNGSANKNGASVWFNQNQYPWPDQIVTGGSGSPVAQCIITGVSGSVAPTWPFTLGASVTDGSAAWATVAIN